MLDYSVVTDVDSSGSDRRTSNNQTANSTIRTATNLATLRIWSTTSIRDTQISLVIRIGYSRLALRISDTGFSCMFIIVVLVVKLLIVLWSGSVYMQAHRAEC